jgi:RES domain-containing protein
MPEPARRHYLTLWRAFVPRWAHLPLSGEAAARFGGRWNLLGVPTIYAACQLSTAWAEYNQGFVQHPALIARLQLSGARLADLTEAQMLGELGVPPESISANGARWWTKEKCRTPTLSRNGSPQMGSTA